MRATNSILSQTHHDFKDRIERSLPNPRRSSRPLDDLEGMLCRHTPELRIAGLPRHRREIARQATEDRWPSGGAIPCRYDAPHTGARGCLPARESIVPPAAIVTWASSRWACHRARSPARARQNRRRQGRANGVNLLDIASRFPAEHDRSQAVGGRSHAPRRSDSRRRCFSPATLPELNKTLWIFASNLRPRPAWSTVRRVTDLLPSHRLFWAIAFCRIVAEARNISHPEFPR